MICINEDILSFTDIALAAGTGSQSVLLVRHSYRESLVNGNYDPGLTAAGWNYAVACGTFLQGMKDLCFGASSRRRTVETVQGLMCGGRFKKQEVFPLDILRETAMFSKPENLEAAIDNGTLPATLDEYYSTGTARGMRPMQEYVADLLEVLTTTHQAPNAIFCSHDIVLVALLKSLKVYNFVQDDWCGYIQGAFLCRKNGSWSIAYVVPDKSNRKKHTLFV